VYHVEHMRHSEADALYASVQYIVNIQCSDLYSEVKVDAVCRKRLIYRKRNETTAGGGKQHTHTPVDLVAQMMRPLILISPVCRRLDQLLESLLQNLPFQ
jgi:hypothetical protein